MYLVEIVLRKRRLVGADANLTSLSSCLQFPLVERKNTPEKMTAVKTVNTVCAETPSKICIKLHFFYSWKYIKDASTSTFDISQRAR